MPDWGSVASWAGVVTALAASLYAVWRSERRHDEGAFAEWAAGIEERFRKIEERQAELEADMRAMPSNAALDRLDERLDQLHGDFRELSGTVRAWGENQKGLTETLQRLNSYLLTKGQAT